MDDSHAIIDEISSALKHASEWLILEETGETMSVLRAEIDVFDDHGKVFLNFPTDRGIVNFKIENLEQTDGEIHLINKEKTLKLIQRPSAARLRAETEIAKILRANAIARVFIEKFGAKKIESVRLNHDGGRLAKIVVLDARKFHSAVLADISEQITPERLLSEAIIWRRFLDLRTKNPCETLYVLAKKETARGFAKLLALLNEKAKRGIAAAILAGEEILPLEIPEFNELLHERAPKLTLSEIRISKTAEKIRQLAPQEIDVISTAQGETLRYLGLPFFRVRRVGKIERAWFGTDSRKKPFSVETEHEFSEFFEQITRYRTAETEVKHHTIYNAAPEGWLESLLRKNIAALDANLTLSPIYNQLRVGRDKLDLLAIRKDGRLVVIEIKTSPDREMVFQALDYWRKIELLRRGGILQKMQIFGNAEILDEKPLIYLVAPALCFHRQTDEMAKLADRRIEFWQFELNSNWRSGVKVITRKREING